MREPIRCRCSLRRASSTVIGDARAWGSHLSVLGGYLGFIISQRRLCESDVVFCEGKEGEERGTEGTDEEALFR